MATKSAVVLLAVLAVVSASEKAKRQSGTPDFSEYWNQFQEQMKPITGQFPSLPSNGFGSFPTIPGFGGSSGSTGTSGLSGGSVQYKRQVNPNSMNEWFSQLQETGNNLSGNFPFKPPASFGQFPFPGSASGSSESAGSQNP